MGFAEVKRNDGLWDGGWAVCEQVQQQCGEAVLSLSDNSNKNGKKSILRSALTIPFVPVW